MAFPSLALVRTSGGAFQLAFAPAFTCQLQASTNLGNWQTLFTTNNISADTLLLEFTDTNAAESSHALLPVGQTFAGQPVFANCFATNQSVSLGCVAAPVLACQIEASTNLSSWTAILISNLPAAAPFQFKYAEATNSPVRFYRLSQDAGLLSGSSRSRAKGAIPGRGFARASAWCWRLRAIHTAGYPDQAAHGETHSGLRALLNWSSLPARSQHPGPGLSPSPGSEGIPGWRRHN